MGRGITGKIIDLMNLGWTDEKIAELTGYELAWIKRTRKQVEENEKNCIYCMGRTKREGKT